MPGIRTGDLFIEGFGGIRRILDFTMEEGPGAHTRGSIRAEMAKTAGTWGYQGPVHSQGVTVRARGEEHPIYTGAIQEIYAREENGVHQARLELASATVWMDLEKKDHSYQDTGMSYGALMGQVCREAKAAGSWPAGLDGTPIGVPRIQYQETDWEFLKRLASHWGLPLYDQSQQGGAGVRVGVPERGEGPPLDWCEYTAILDKGYYQLRSLGYVRDQLRIYEVESVENRQVGERTEFQGRTLTILEKRCESRGGSLVFSYCLGLPECVGTRRMSNERLTGLSLLGTVLAREGETVRLKLDIDEGHPDQNEGNAYPFPWTPATGNQMYLMPEVGSRVSLYFKGNEESSAAAVNCIRREGEGGGRDYRERSLVTQQGKEMKLHPCCMGFISAGQRLFIDDASGISIGGKGSLQIAAGGAVKMEGKRIALNADKGNLSCYHGSGEVGEEGKVSFAADSELHILDGGENIACLGSGRSRIAGYEHKPYGAESRYRDDPEEESYDTAGLVVRVIAGGVVVCGATIATGGIAAAAGASAATGTAMMSAAAMTGGLAVAGMAATDYVSGRLSSYESYMKTALAGSVVGAMTGAAAYAPVSGGLAHGALDVGTGMAGDALMQLAMTEKVDGEQMFYSGMVSVLVGAVMRGGGSGAVTNADNLDDLRYEKYWDDVRAGKYDVPYGMTEDEYYEFLKGMDRVDKVIKGGNGALKGDPSAIKTVNDLTQEQIDALIKYSGDDYANINRSLRGLEIATPENQATINAMKSALDNASLSKDMVLYRGTSTEALGNLKNLSPEELIGKQITESGFMSTSTSSTVASGTFSGNLQIKIEASSGAHALDISSISQYSNEAEILFNAGQKMTIISAESKNGILYITVLAQ